MRRKHKSTLQKRLEIKYIRVNGVGWHPDELPPTHDSRSLAIWHRSPDGSAAGVDCRYSSDPDPLAVDGGTLCRGECVDPTG